MVRKKGKKGKKLVRPNALNAPSTCTSSVLDDFNSLAISDHSAKKIRRNIVQEFDDYFGTDKLENWRKVCRDVGIEMWEQLSSKKQCKKALVGVWVNIYDFIDAIRAEKPVKRFPSQSALAKYTMKTRRFYPKDQAKKDGPVRALLAHIFGNS